jgi:hypothetical protein
MAFRGVPKKSKYEAPRRCVPTISSVLLSQIQRGNFQQRGANLAVEGGMGSNGNDKTRLEEDICIHIFTVSSAMVGVCLMVIGVIRVVITLGKADTLANDFLASDALLFPRSSGPAVFGGGIKLSARPTLFLSPRWWL